jgi:hypothetical protein
MSLLVIGAALLVLVALGAGLRRLFERWRWHSWQGGDHPTGAGEAEDSARLVELLTGLEAQLPLARDRLEAFFQTRFRTARDHNGYRVFVGRTARYRVEVQLPEGTFRGRVQLHFSPAMASGSESALAALLPGGWRVPPPPRSHGASPELAGAYVVDRPWGQIWVTSHKGDRVWVLALEPGRRGSPGV